jgi:hypothetical protein
LLRGTDYTTSGNNTVILSTAAAASDIVEVITITNLSSVNTYTQAEIDTALGLKLSTATAASTYLTQSNAASTYLTQSSASSTYLTQSNASSTYAPLSNPTFTAIGGDEGGQINLAAAATNSTLSGPINLDVWRNRIRLFEGGGNNRGAFIDLSTLSNGVGSELIAAAPQSGNSGKYLTTNGTNATWATVSSGGMTLLSENNMSGVQDLQLTNLFTGSYKQILIVGRNLVSTPNDAFVQIRVRQASGTIDSRYRGTSSDGSTVTGFGVNGDSYLTMARTGQNDNYSLFFKWLFYQPIGESYFHSEWVSTSGAYNLAINSVNDHQQGIPDNVNIKNSLGNFSRGTIYVYGIK